MNNIITNSDLDLSIVIVNYNGKRFLKDCLDSIAEHVSCAHEVIVVDNASSDGSVEFIRSYFPAVTLIANPENSGFAVGNNIGANVARGKWILLLNNDTVLLTDVSSAIALLKSEPQIGIVGAMMRGRQNEYRFSAGYFPSPFRLIRLSSMYRKVGPFRDGSFATASNSARFYPVDWVEGSFLLTRIELWQRLGGLDQRYFMYVEDVDFCKRVILAGFTCVYMPEVKFVHYGGYGATRLSMVVKGFLRYHKSYSGPGTRALVTVVLVAKLTMSNLLHTLQFLITRSQASQDRARASRQALQVVLRGG